MRNIDFTKQADKFLRKLQKKQQRQVSSKIRDLLDNPFPNDCVSIQGVPNFYRVDVGEFRVCYTLNTDTLTIAMVGKRNDNEVYRKFKRLF